MIVAGLLILLLNTPSLPCLPSPPHGFTAISANFGTVVAPTQADADRALQAGRVAREAANRYLGLQIAPLLIAPRSLSLPTNGCSFVFGWPFHRDPVGTPPPPSHVFPHEIGHAVFIRFLVPKTIDDEYGGDAPDWLDEMAALAFEDASGVEARRADGRRYAQRHALIPLERLLSMPHPEWAARRNSLVAAKDGSVSMAASRDTPAYYATVRVFLDFLIERTGNQKIIRDLAHAFQSGTPIDRWLVTQVYAPDKRRNVRNLDADMTAFVLSNHDYAVAYDEFMRKTGAQ